MQTHFVRLGRCHKIPRTIPIKHEFIRMMREGEAARAKPNVMTGLADQPRTGPGAAMGAASPPGI